MKVTGHTSDFIRKLAESCVVRIESIKAKNKYPGPRPDAALKNDLNAMALDYFVGATALAGVLGIETLYAHLQHVVATEIDIHGIDAVYKLARRSSVAISKPSTNTEN